MILPKKIVILISKYNLFATTLLLNEKFLLFKNKKYLLKRVSITNVNKSDYSYMIDVFSL